MENRSQNLFVSCAYNFIQFLLYGYTYLTPHVNRSGLQTARAPATAATAMRLSRTMTATRASDRGSSPAGSLQSVKPSMLHSALVQTGVSLVECMNVTVPQHGRCVVAWVHAGQSCAHSSPNIAGLPIVLQHIVVSF